MKRSLFFLAVLNVATAFAVPWKANSQKLSNEQAGKLFNLYPYEEYQKVVPPNILAEKYYVEMAREGWTLGEIVRLTDEYLQANNSQVKRDGSYIDYSKIWRPYNVSSQLMNAELMAYTQPQQLEKAKSTVLSTQVDANTYYPRIFYTPNDRLAKIRNTGYFRHNACLPSGGRVPWMVINQDNPDKLMVIPDGEGIWRTDDMGKHWDCITERIPNRYDRNESDQYSIPVDPDNWDHVFAFMDNNTVYETTNGGQTWRKIIGAKHYQFRRGYCFRDAAGKLKFIAAEQGDKNGIDCTLWLSSDTCKTWTTYKATAQQKDMSVTLNGVTTSTFWFQEIEFDPSNRDVIYATGSRRILKSTDAGKTWSSMYFKVYGASTSVLRAESTDLFPLTTASSPMFLTINPNNAKEMWAALGDRTNDQTALYKTTDGGASWITLHEPSAGIGSGVMYGGNTPGPWLGSFTVNPVNQSYMAGCTMSCGESNDGGVTFINRPWTVRSKGFYPDGNLYLVSVASHNADNHVLKTSKTGRIFRGSDAGLLMKDPNINNNDWTNIGGDMGQMMFYSIATNDFGDFSIVANTQDINAQTYHGGRWGMARGYEGSTVWMNPYSSEEHFSGGASGRTNIVNQDYTSWSKGWAIPDVCTGNWFLRRAKPNPDGSCFSVIKDFGQTSIAIDDATNGYVTDFALSRDLPTGKLFVLRNKKLYASTNSGATFTPINIGSIVPTAVAVNPNNSNEIYLGKDGAVYQTVNGGVSWQTISTAALTGVNLTRLIYHEGSGDLYFVSSVHGIFLREAGTTDWVLWTKGYNTAKLTDAQINYTTQEMIITDYGTGVWIADLQHPADRYLKNGFTLKQLSNINNTRTFGIDVTYTIPLYYYYKWYVNDVYQPNETGQYLSVTNLQPNDKVRLEVTLRESPDVTTTSADFVVGTDNTITVQNKRGNNLYSNQKGRVDLGYVDHFFGNFSLQMWVNPKSDGVILANRQVNTNGVKGFYLAVASGKLKFTYAPENNFAQPYNETGRTYEFTLDGGLIPLNSWSQITITHNRKGNILLYINGELKATQVRAIQEKTLNNSLYLSLFADGYEMNPIDAAVDELKIWNEVLDLSTVRLSMYANVSPANAKLIYYNDFNAATLEAQKERFSQKGMAPRVNAVVSVNESALGVCAANSNYSTLTNNWVTYASLSNSSLEIKNTNLTYQPKVLGAAYNGSFIGAKTNLLSTYYNVYPIAFGVKLFDVTDYNSTVDIKLNLDPTLADSYANAKVYSMDLNANVEVWNLLPANALYNSIDKSIILTGVKASDINNKQLALVNAKACIELNASAVQIGDELNVYSPDTVKVPLNAVLAGGMQAPNTAYTLTANSPIVAKIDPLVFVNGTASSNAYVVMEDNDQLYSKAPITISGQDASLKPMNLTAVNMISSKTIKTGIKFNKGGANIGSGSTFAALSGKNTATYMTWVKLDDISMLTGFKMLLFFRGTGSNATGLALNNGVVTCHWNDESWSWNVNSGLTLTASDIGKWVHVAMTASPTGLNFYLNGKKGNPAGSNLSSPVISTPLMLGKNKVGTIEFIGTFDQASVWNRTLTQAEIVKFMHSRAYLNEPGLISYLTFDKVESNGSYMDVKSGAAITLDGVVEKNLVSNLPFNAVVQQARTKALNDGVLKDSVAFTLPTAYPISNVYYTSRFEGVPYNAIDTKYPKQLALENGFRTLSFGTIRNFTASENIQLTVTNPAIQDGDSVAFYARSIGSLSAFSSRYSVLAQTGNATFTIPATVFNENITYMFYRTPREANSVVEKEAYRYKLSIDNGYCTIQNLRGSAKVTVLDMTSKVIAQKQTNDAVLQLKLHQGVYIVKIEEYGIVCMTKIVI